MEMKIETRKQVALDEAWSESGEPTRFQLNLTWVVDTVGIGPDGSAQLRAQIERFAGESARTTLPAEDYVGKTVTYLRRPDGSLDDVQAPPDWLTEGKLPGWLRSWLTQAADRHHQLPSERKPGQRWAGEQTLRVPGLPPLRLRRESTYLRNETHRPVPCALLLTRFSLEGTDTDLEPLEEQSRAVSSVRGSGESLNCYHLATGRLLESTHASREDILMHAERREAGRSPTRVTLRAQTTVDSFLRLIE